MIDLIEKNAFYSKQFTY